MKSIKMLSKEDIKIVKSTIPLLEKYGVKVTSRMYELLFQRYPETKFMFTKDNSEGLAKALLAYARNVENLDRIKEALSKVALSHVRAGVRPEHYAIVWECLRDSIRENLTEDDKVIGAWERAYWELANYLAKLETKIYDALKG
ncbi:MAG: globin domain-containing protein [Candidatus Aramenus sp.]|jgi:nitric oxide dioxygenase|nr:globin domain-containing protein [Candidatus Aramenus sp.]